MLSPHHRHTYTQRWTVLGLVLPLLVYAARAIPVLRNPYLPFDTEYIYLPLARRLLENPWLLWKSPDVLQTAPGVFVYMAFTGADLVTLKCWNLALALITVALLFDSGRRIAGPAAAAAAAWFCAVSPTLIVLSVWPMAEPPFLFLVALWFWSCTCCLDPNASRVLLRTAPVIAGLALGLATLTRATYMYWIPAALLVLSVVACVPRWRKSFPWHCLLTSHLIALACVGSYMTLNAHTLKKPAIATGAGAALYFGSNAMLRGQEPHHFGLMHDNVTVTGFVNHLSPEGDAKLVKAARNMVSALPASTLTTLYAEKAAKLLFFSKSHLSNYTERMWRVVLLVLAICGIWIGRRQPIFWLLSGAMLYQWIVLIPVLYNPRYSISALDTGLTLLAAAGIGAIWNSPRRKLLATAIACTMLLAVLGAAWHQRQSPMPLPRLDVMQPQRLKPAESPEITVTGFDQSPFQETVARTSTGEFSITWQSTFPELEGTMLLRLGISEMQGSCKHAWLVNTDYQGKERVTRIRLQAWKGDTDFSWGLNRVLMPQPSRQLQLRFECTAGTRARFSGLGLYDASAGRWLDRQKQEAIQ
ncbi:ArnT family glycosyltransferase [Delftia acidovorans]|uniref:ArnT family glycosyltransferase n=1 Tax=Delftia acidovorans TaxID=80866 RepID=UPI00241F674F|nr:glycosyltransferase family 39 protein [Delftia acidovorans]